MAAISRIADDQSEPRLKGYGPTDDGQGWLVNFRDGLGYEVRFGLHHEPAPFQVGQKVMRDNDHTPYIVHGSEEMKGEWLIWLRPEGNVPESEQFGVGAKFLREADQEREALIMVDVQKDFLPGGALPVPEGDAVIPALQQAATDVRSLGGKVFASFDWHPADHMSFKSNGGEWPEHCLAGTPGAMLHPSISALADNVGYPKGKDPEVEEYSAMTSALVHDLREAGITRLYVGGLATEYCVKATVLDALALGFKVVVLPDACKGLGGEDEALAEMEKAGAEV